MPNLPENWIELVTPGLANIFWRGIGETAETHERTNVFHVAPSARAFEEMLGVGNLSNEGWNVGASGRVQFDTIPKLWKPEFHHEEFAKGIQIKKSLFEDNLYSDAGLPATITDQPAILARNAEVQRELAAVEVFNYADVSTGLTPSGFPIAGPDGSALLATDHELFPGAGSGDDQSNLYANLPLDTAAIKTMRADARKWTDNAGNPMGVRLNQLLVSVEDSDAADIIRMSALQPGTANNDANTAKNYLGGGVVVWDYLESDRYFYMDAMLRQRLLLWFERVGLEFAADAPLTTLVGRWRARMRYTRGYVHWAFTAGSVTA